MNLKSAIRQENKALERSAEDVEKTKKSENKQLLVEKGEQEAMDEIDLGDG